MNFYNENDPKAAAWLRELIKQGHIAHGIVDERSIADINPSDLRNFVQCHFFAGIGGWSVALRLAGWPDNRPVWTGSCPCQPFSAAGLGLAEKDPRHLWPQFYSLITHCQPTVIFGEQVASKAGRVWLAGIRADLEGVGYAVGAADLCAAGVGSPQIRQRLYWMANAKSDRCNRRNGEPGDPLESTRPRNQFERRGFACRLGHSDSPGSLARRQTTATDGHRGAAEPDGNACRLANADGGVPGDRDSQCGGQHGQQQENPRACGMDQPNCLGGEAGVSGSLAREKRDSGISHDTDTKIDAGGRERERDASGLGNANQPRPQRRKFNAHEYPGQFTPWSASELIDCTDGKARRVEPGTFPLAHGVSGRVGLLRGYGNAIVPFLAAEFIRAAEEAGA